MSTTSLIFIIITTALVNNVVLSQFLGICSFLGVSKSIKNSAALGVAVIFVITIASAVANLLHTFILKPLDLEYLNTIVFILVIAALVQVVEMFLKKTSPAIYRALGIFLPLITTNCAVLGVVQTNSDSSLDFLTSLANGLGTSIGFLVVIVLFACMRERMNGYNIPKAMKGVPIALITAALMAMAFMGFGGMVG